MVDIGRHFSLDSSLKRKNRIEEDFDCELRLRFVCEGEERRKDRYGIYLIHQYAFTLHFQSFFFLEKKYSWKKKVFLRKVWKWGVKALKVYFSLHYSLKRKNKIEEDFDSKLGVRFVCEVCRASPRPKGAFL